MSQISKCPKVTVVLTYWEASGEVSELSYKSLLYSTSVGSYCSRSEGLSYLPNKGSHVSSRVPMAWTRNLWRLKMGAGSIALFALQPIQPTRALFKPQS